MTRSPLPPTPHSRRVERAPLFDLDRRLREYAISLFGRFDWRRSRREQQLLPELATRISRAVRAGRPVEHALLEAATTNHPSVQRVCEQLDVGRRLDDAIDGWARRVDSDAEHLLVAAISLGTVSGGDLARALDLVGAGIRDDLQLDARRRTLLTQSRLSAGVLVALPIVFALVASALQGQWIYRGVSGVVLLAIGGGLDLVGLMWIRRLLRGLS